LDDKLSSEDIHDHSDRSKPLQIRNANRRTLNSGRSRPSHRGANSHNAMRNDRPIRFGVLQSYPERIEI
jgi:hypothetical protein